MHEGEGERRHTEKFELMSQRHAVPSIRGRELARVHAEDGAHEGQWEENDRDGGEQHDRAALSDRLIGAFERVFRFNDAGLLLLEVQEIFQLRLRYLASPQDPERGLEELTCSHA